MKRRWSMIGEIYGWMAMMGALSLGGCPPPEGEVVAEKAAPALSDRGRTESIKTLTERVVGETQGALAGLAHTLGFGWCGGCRDQYVGSDLYRSNQANGTITIAANTSDCPDENKGHMWDQRLSMDYWGWTVLIEDLVSMATQEREGEPIYLVIHEVINNSDAEQSADTQIKVSYSSTLTNQTSITESSSNTVSIKITEKAKAGIPFIGEVEFTFEQGWQGMWSSSVTESESESKTAAMEGTATIKVTVPPRSKAVVRTYAMNKQYTMDYEATMTLLSNVTLKGFMRWRDGGGNFHRSHRGSEDRAHVEAVFGNTGENFTFADDILEQSANNWGDFDWFAALSYHGAYMQWALDYLRWFREAEQNRSRFTGRMQFKKATGFQSVVGEILKLTEDEKQKYASGITIR